MLLIDSAKMLRSSSLSVWLARHFKNCRLRKALFTGERRSAVAAREAKRAEGKPGAKKLG